MSIELFGLENIPIVDGSSDISKIIKEAIEKQGCGLHHGDIVLIAETLISKAEENFIKLDELTPSKQAIELAVTGPSLRATGVARDLRTTMFEYDNFDFNVITQPDGDVKSNLLMRALESFESIKIIRQAIANIPEGKLVNHDWEMVDMDMTQSYIEVPRGTLYHSYALESGRVRHCIIRTPSMANIGAMQYACIGDQITDAQLCIVQCDPCFTCTDRAIEIIRR